jgi:hypothetical protein
MLFMIRNAINDQRYHFCCRIRTIRSVRQSKKLLLSLWFILNRANILLPHDRIFLRST